MSELYIKVQPPASTETGYQRPTEWLTMPTITSPSFFLKSGPQDKS